MEFKDLVKFSLRQLGRRPHSVQETKRFLFKKTQDTDLIDRTVKYLTDNKFLNDVDFARWLVESRSRSHPRGPRLLVQELKQKGVNTQIEIDEEAVAMNALKKKQKSWAKLTARDRRLKATHFLRYRGFSWAVIEKVTRKMYNDTHVN